MSKLSDDTLDAMLEQVTFEDEHKDVSLAGLSQKLLPLKGTFLQFPAISEILISLDRLMEFGNVGAEVGSPAKCMLITGPSGIGKSALLKRWAAKHESFETPLGYCRPVLYVEVSCESTPKSLVENMLAKLGLPDAVSSRTTEARLKALVKHHLREQQVKVLVIDEVQELVELKSINRVQKVSNTIKGLLNEAICPIVLAGTTEAEVIFTHNIQLERRALCRSRLTPFDWGNEMERAQFQLLLAAYEKNLPFSEPSKLSGEKTAFRIHTLTEGHIGRTFDFVLAACTHALLWNEDHLSQRALRKTANDLWPDIPNPFDAEFDTCDQTRNSDGDGGRVTRLRKGKAALKQEDVLRG